MRDAEDERTLELARTQLAERLQRQHEEIRAVDTKSQVLLGFSVTALTVVLTVPMPEAARYVSALCFLPAFLFGGMALAVWRYKDPVAPDELVAKHISSGYKHLLLVTVASHRFVVNANAGVIRERIKHWQWGLGSLALAVAVGAVGLTIGDETVSGEKPAEQSEQQNQSLADQVEAADVMAETVQKDAKSQGETRRK